MVRGARRGEIELAFRQGPRKHGREFWPIYGTEQELTVLF